MTTTYDKLFLEGATNKPTMTVELYGPRSEYYGKSKRRRRKTKRQLEREARQRVADHVDGYDRDDLGESPDY